VRKASPARLAGIYNAAFSWHFQYQPKTLSRLLAHAFLINYMYILFININVIFG